MGLDCLNKCAELFIFPTKNLSIKSRASMECPTSSNTSVASINLLSLITKSFKTSSPPGCLNNKKTE